MEIMSSYQSLEDTNDKVQTELGNQFFVVLSGKTTGAHQPVVDRLTGFGHVEVHSAEDSHYLLVFCPIATRVQTDINNVFSKIPADKPVILVVMHHTFNPELPVADSRKHVQKQNIVLTVDCLFHEGELLHCSRNENAFSEIGRVLGVPLSQGLSSRHGFPIKGLTKKQILIALAVISLVVVLIAIIIRFSLK
ncbi:uncharacterized protein LOC112451333 isoform X2 [Kryptolebias marmoratus]|uniref:uncharacterized protein LOC112451333 isoform X2 n=1 Tax=Kryptolebias marmoratus TaxID=37003 RepID=UPI000D53044F|nr:uncharacterized protein LOC112451333 isoform X2 [Kryptolebias marmoratus]